MCIIDLHKRPAQADIFRVLLFERLDRCFIRDQDIEHAFGSIADGIGDQRGVACREKERAVVYAVPKSRIIIGLDRAGHIERDPFGNRLEHLVAVARDIVRDPDPAAGV